MLKLTLLSLSVFFSTFLIAQQQSFHGGIKLTNDLTFYHGWAGGFGALAIYKLGKHNGIESGIYYTNREHWLFLTPSAIVKGRQKRIYMPFLYRYESKVLNFTTGPILDFLAKWEVSEKLGDPNLIDYSWNTVDILSSVSVSKSIYISNRISLEPEIRFNYSFSEKDGSAGINLAISKQLF